MNLIKYWEQFVNRLSLGKFERDIAKVSSGIIAGYFIVGISYPVITRLYSPDNFGILGVFMAIMAILYDIASLKYELAIPIEKEDLKAANLLVLSLIIVLILCFIISLILFLIDDILIRFIEPQLIDKYWYLIIIGFIFGGAYKSFNYWAIRRSEFSAIAKTKFNQSLGMVIFQIGLGIPGLGLMGLLVGEVVGRGLGTSTLVSVAYKDISIIRKVNFAGIKESFIRFKRFPIYSTISSIMDSLGREMPSLVLAFIYSPKVVGWFVLGYKIVGIPSSLLGRSVAQVYYNEFSTYLKTKKSELEGLYNNTAKKLFFIGIIPITIIVIIGGWGFEFIFGEEWYNAGLYVQILGFSFLAQFIVSPLSQTLNILEKQHWHTYWSGIRFVFVLVVFLIAYLLNLKPYWTITLYSVVIFITYCLHFFLSKLAIRDEVE